MDSTDRNRRNVRLEVKQAATNKVEAQRTKEKIRSENTRFTRVAN